MIAVDTNVLVRLLVRDDAAQFALAQSYMSKHCSTDDPAFVNRVVLVEFVWVLESCYAYPRDRIAQAIDGILATAVLSVEDAPRVRAALARYRNGTDFADALIATTNVHAGASTTLTFDKQAARRGSDDFTLLK